MKKLTVLFSFIILQLVAQTSPAFIINGTDATAADVQKNGVANSTVGIQSLMPIAPGRLKNIFLCTGTLIESDIIVTAAHCLWDFKMPYKNVQYPTSISIYLQTLKMNSTAVSFPATDYVIHPYFLQNPNIGRNDIAIIKLSTPAPESVTPTQLVPSNLDITPLAKKSAGYGYKDIYEDSRSGIGILSWTIIDGLKILPETEDAKIAGMLNSDASRTQISHGDSGGPLYVIDNKKTFLAGVNSGTSVWTYSDGKTPNTYTNNYINISEHRKFIQEAIKFLRSDKKLKQVNL